MVDGPGGGGVAVKSATTICLRIGLAGIFLYAGLIKAGSSHEFALALLPFTFVPPEWSMPIALALAFTELLAGVLLLMPRVYPIGAGLVCTLCVLFIGVLTWALANGIVVDCGCFGKESEPSKWKMLFAVGRDIMILTAATALFLMSRIGKKT